MKNTMLSLAVVVLLLLSARLSPAGSTSETFFVGSVIGGTSSITVGQVERYGYPPPFPPFFISPPHFHPKPYRHYRKYPHRYYDRDCRIVEYHTYRYGQRYTTTQRICRDDRDYRDRRYRDWDRRDWNRDRWDRRDWDHWDRRDREWDRDRQWDRDDYRHDWRGGKRSRHGNGRVWQ